MNHTETETMAREALMKGASGFASQDLARELLKLLEETRTLREALRDVRNVFPVGTCSACAGFDHEVGEANRMIDAALAAVPSEGER